MNDPGLPNFLQEQKQRIDEILTEQIKVLNTPDRLKEAMLYSVQAGGKRIRPILLLATMEAFGCDSDPGLPVACAIEMVHTYSLIHDDLPAMDDDDLRRGQPTNHKVFGEAMAVLAGDALLTFSFEVIARIDDSQVPGQKKARLVTGLAMAAGAEGMVGGQSADLQAEGQTLSLDELEDIHLHKTGKLLSFAVEAGAILAGAPPKHILQLRGFSRNLGLAFQIRDDILDVEGNLDQMGKTPGSDTSRQKSTYPQLLTIDGAKQKCTDHVEQAKKSLQGIGLDGRLLEQIADYIVMRDC